MAKTKRLRLTRQEAELLFLKVKPNDKNRNTARYCLNDSQLTDLSKVRSNGDKISVSTTTSTKPNDYKGGSFVLSAWNRQDGTMMDIDNYCTHYNLPRVDISSYKLVSHTGTPFYNIVFKEKVDESVTNIDFDAIIQKHVKRFDVDSKVIDTDYDFDSLTYTDLHIGMDTDKDKNSMYADEWNREEVIKTAVRIVKETIKNKKSNLLVVDDLGDLMDGYNGYTTRGGHELPQNMTNEEAFDCALSFKSILMDGLVTKYEKIIFNNICNDNHAGSFGYFVNKAFKDIAELKYNNVEVNNHRTFLSHYYIKDVCFIITHGKDDKTLKFGFKPELDTKQIEKIDQYCKHNNIYSKSKRIIFKKGDSHQSLLDMAGSDDFDYYNYPAASPSSQWVQNNFKKGRRGVFIENFKGITNTITPVFF